MAIPVINPTTSILDYLQWEPWQYQPYATNTPTSWSIDPSAPTGMDFDAATGRISGACSTPGVYVFSLRAHNGDGASAPLVITTGIGASGSDQRAMVISVDIDVVTRRAVVNGVAAAATADYQHAIKYNDDLIYSVRFFNGATRVDPPIVGLGWALKYALEDPPLATASYWRKTGYGLNASFAAHGRVQGGALRAALLDAQATQKTADQSFIGSVEFEWLQANDGPDAVGPDPLRGSSQPMKVLAALDYQQIAIPEEE